MRVVLPAPIQTLLALGDRYLAANAYVIRAATFNPLSEDALSFAVQAKVQSQAAILNPCNEDNGMLAAATLSWEDQVEAAQFVLAEGVHCRTWDPMPPFFQGFNEFYFNNDPMEAGRLVSVAAQRAEGPQRLGLQNIASRWLTHGQQPEFAIAVIMAMRESTSDHNQRRLLGARIERLQGLVALRQAAATYTAERGMPITSLQALVDASYLEALPVDPFQRGYVLDEHGVPQFNRSGSARQKGG